MSFWLCPRLQSFPAVAAIPDSYAGSPRLSITCWATKIAVVLKECYLGPVLIVLVLCCNLTALWFAVWMLNNWLVLTTVAMSCGPVIAMCDLRLSFPQAKSVLKSAGQVANHSVKSSWAFLFLHLMAASIIWLSCAYVQPALGLPSTALTSPQLTCDLHQPFQCFPLASLIPMLLT